MSNSLSLNSDHQMSISPHQSGLQTDPLIQVSSKRINHHVALTVQHNCLPDDTLDFGTCSSLPEETNVSAAL